MMYEFDRFDAQQERELRDWQDWQDSLKYAQHIGRERNLDVPEMEQLRHCIYDAIRKLQPPMDEIPF